MPIEQARWNQSNIDSLFYAGSQTFINRYFNFTPSSSYQNFYFNLLQQPVNLVTGYERQHRKQINYLPTQSSDPHTCDQYTRLVGNLCNQHGIHEQFSRGCEQAAVCGLTLLQPYLDYNGDDNAQGELKVKLWEYNSYLIDPYCRDFATGSDAQFVWCQEYISKKEAEFRFPDQLEKIAPMAGTPQRYGSFYFLPENYNMARNDLMVLSYVWYKWKRMKKRLYSRSRNQFFDFAQGQNMDAVLYNIPDLELVETEVPTWKLAVVLNDQLMFQGDNPLGYDDFPFVMCVWNYEPHLNYFDLRCRGLVRTMRDSNYLLNRRIIINHDITEATINSGWKRKIGAVGNEDNLKKSGQGWDILVNEGYEMTDVEKIMPSGVPESDMALADQMQQLIFSTSGINLENWSAQDQPNSSFLTTLTKQAANLMVLQKYFDQWDLSKKWLGHLILQVILNNWSAEKIQFLLGEQPSPFFYSKIFAKYQVIVEEGILTPTQQYQEYQAWLELNQQLGGIIPAVELAKRAPIQGKSELMEILDQQQKQQAAAQEHQMQLQSAVEDAKLKELYTKAMSNLATARERHGRAEADIGLFEERLSEITHNRAMATKAKMEALEKMVDVIAKFGEVETSLKIHQLQGFDYAQEQKENLEKADAKRTAFSNEFVNQIVGQMNQATPSTNQHPSNIQQAM